MCEFQSWFSKSELFSAKNSLFQSYKKSTLNSVDSELIASETGLNFSVANGAHSEKIRADQVRNSIDQRWYLACSLIQRWRVLKNVKYLKHCCSALIISGATTREPWVEWPLLSVCSYSNICNANCRRFCSALQKCLINAK